MNGARIVRGANVILVSGIAAFSSYWHMAHVALRYGERDEVAYVLPLSVDGVLTVAAIVMTEDRRNHRPIHPWTWTAFITGLTASIAANITGADPTPGGRLIAAWPPIALLLTVEMLTHARPGPATTKEPPDNATNAGARRSGESSGDQSGRHAGATKEPNQAPDQSADQPTANGRSPQHPRSVPVPAPEQERNTDRNNHEVPPSRPARRPIALTRKLAAELLANEPDLSQEDLAAQLQISTRRLRTVMAPSEDGQPPARS